MKKDIREAFISNEYQHSQEWISAWSELVNILIENGLDNFHEYMMGKLENSNDPNRGNDIYFLAKGVRGLDRSKIGMYISTLKWYFF